jgi:Na+-transporting NADH:ubiquinone oxidoreductase subunit NqrD
VTAPRPPSWGETITIVERRGQGRANQETVVPAALEVPSGLPAVGTVLTGHIAGQVTAPRLTETSQFNTTTESLDVPVQLEVVSALDLWWDRFSNAVRMFFDEDRWLLVTIGALLTWCVVAGGAAILYRVRQT